MSTSVSLLSAGESNTKVAKGHALPYTAAILHLSPADKSGYNTCPYADTCAAPCLDSAGRGKFDTTQAARIRKTRWFFEDRAGFMAQLVKDIAALERKAARDGNTAVVRLNGTSDIGWTRVSCTRDNVTYRNVFECFPNVQFYDYTKVPTRFTQQLPANYHVTFSLGGTNDTNAHAALNAGMNLAVVLRVKKGMPLPATWNGRAVIDGDTHDFRFLDPQGGYIVGLRAKGDAIGDTSGFVRDIDGTLDTGRMIQLHVRQTAYAAD